MNRYLPARSPWPSCRDLAYVFGFVWAGLMFGSAALNIALGTHARSRALVGDDVDLGASSARVALFPDPVRHDAHHRRAARTPLRPLLQLRAST